MPAGQCYNDIAVGSAADTISDFVFIIITIPSYVVVVHIRRKMAGFIEMTHPQGCSSCFSAREYGHVAGHIFVLLQLDALGKLCAHPVSSFFSKAVTGAGNLAGMSGFAVYSMD